MSFGNVLQGSLDSSKTESFVKNLQMDGRYLRDVWWFSSPEISYARHLKTFICGTGCRVIIQWPRKPEKKVLGGWVLCGASHNAFIAIKRSLFVILIVNPVILFQLTGILFLLAVLNLLGRIFEDATFFILLFGGFEVARLVGVAATYECYVVIYRLYKTRIIIYGPFLSHTLSLSPLNMQMWKSRNL